MTPSYTLNAKRDLKQILEHIAIDSCERGAKFVEGIRYACRLIASQPEMGTRQLNRPANYRKLPHHSYVIYYRIISGRVEILRVLHERQNRR